MSETAYMPPTTGVEEPHELTQQLSHTMHGCCHGSLNTIYDVIKEYEQLKKTKVDLLLVGGDFQALRNTGDLDSISVPEKYREMGTFHEYYSGKRVAPVLTIVIGGNHEASNYMWELYHGGWLAPNIYYLGAAGSVIVNGLRIAGISGIYKSGDYKKGHFETVPYTHSSMRSKYHTREYDVLKLKHLSRTTPSVFMSHDWPAAIERWGNLRQLLKRKPHFRQDIESNTLGSPALFDILNTLQPDYWFSGHMHVKFAAVYDHKPDAATSSPVLNSPWSSVPPKEVKIKRKSKREALGHVPNPDEIAIWDEESLNGATEPQSNPDEIAISEDGNPDEIAISESGGSARTSKEPSAGPRSKSSSTGRNSQSPSVQPSPPTNGEPKKTKFLALSKPGPGNDFLQFLDLPAPNNASPPKLTYDPEWLAITRALHPYLSLEMYAAPMPPLNERNQLVADELARIREEGVLVPAEQEKDTRLAEMEAEFEAELAAEMRRQSLAGEGKKKKGKKGSSTSPQPQRVVPGSPQAAALEAAEATVRAKIASKSPPPAPEPTEVVEAPLVWEDASDIDVGRVQQFYHSAPPHPAVEKRMWYTNRQTEAFCGMLGIQNKVNPRPVKR